MNQSPKVALVGRPNVGKSALFNRICNKRISIVDEQEGITRDRLYAEADFFGKPFQIIDTAGIDAGSKIPFNEEVRLQAEIAIEEADRLILVVDGHVGLTLLDEQVARLLHRRGKPVVVAVNKIDDLSQLSLIHQFHSLGISEVIGVSATHGFQVAELLEQALKGIDFSQVNLNRGSNSIKVAIVGRPNVGKSTLVNFLLQEKRCVVSPIPGTTRDSIDVDITVEGTTFQLIDTAGIRRKKSEHEAVEKFAAIRTERAIERADVCVMMLSSEEGMTAQEKRIASEIEHLGKGCILLFNKWDLIKGFRMEHCLASIKDEASFLNYCPTLFVSAQTGRNLNNLYALIKEVYQESFRRITTGQLNKFLESAMQKYHPPMLKGRRLRIYYTAQVGICPPQFVMFVNNPLLMVETYKKYLINQFRETYGFKGVPITFALRGKKAQDPALKGAKEEEAEVVSTSSSSID